MRTVWIRLGAVACVLAAGCQDGTSDVVTNSLEAPAFESITPAQWDGLASQRIFFGHQSVGGNLMEGVQGVLAEHSSIPLRVVEISSPSELSTPAFYHAAIGTNGEPATKLAAFREIVTEGMGDRGIAVLKFCYVDVTV